MKPIIRDRPFSLGRCSRGLVPQPKKPFFELSFIPVNSDNYINGTQSKTSEDDLNGWADAKGIRRSNSLVNPIEVSSKCDVY